MGIGDLGPEAYRFVDFLASSKQRIWQSLPIGPTGIGDSPYQSYSAFAGNPLWISLEQLVDEDLLQRSDLEHTPRFSAGKVNYDEVIQFKLPLLNQAYNRFLKGASSHQIRDFESFCQQNEEWLEDFALFMAVKDAQAGRVWTEWDEGIAKREPEAMSYWQRRLEQKIESFKFQQHQFFKQWAALRQYAHRKNIRIMGDIPIFVAHNSADVWANPRLFQLDERGNPTVVAGVPPDYFSETGQRWGNPLYRWMYCPKRVTNGGLVASRSPFPSWISLN